MANEVLNGTDMTRQFFKRRGLVDQRGHTRPQSVVEAFDVIDFAGFLDDGFVPIGCGSFVGGVSGHNFPL
jgi:hypothetical protein